MIELIDLVSGLRDALSEPELDSLNGQAEPTASACEAAYDLAAALGLCRLGEVELPAELDGTLDEETCHAAAAHAQRHIEQVMTRFKINVGPDAGDSGIAELEDATLWILESRHELWAAETALIEAIDEFSQGDKLDQFSRVLDNLQSRISDLDRLMIDHASEFGAAAELPLLENWRSALSADNRADMPWWLDGTIETAATRAMGRAMRQMPGVEHFRRALRRRWLPRMEAELAMAAEEVRTTAAPRLLEWRSPDQRHHAVLPVPVEVMSDEAEMILSFLDAASGKPATMLVGVKVRLAGCSVSVDAEGVARFRYADLYRLAQLPELEFGEPPEPWTRIAK